MNPLKLFFLGSVLMFLFSCVDDAKKTEPEVVTVDTTEKKVHQAAETKVEFNDPKIAEVYTQYIQLKTALVNSDVAATSKASDDLMTAFANVGVEPDLLQATQDLFEATDIEAQRKSFVVVTNSVEKMLEGAITSGTVYKQFCPMAFGNTGGYWLSNSKDIHNPFFGDAMLKCGRVDKEIK